MDPYALLVGFADRLKVYGVRPVVIGSLEGSGACVGLNWVPLIDDVTTGDVLAGVQVRIRGDAKGPRRAVLDRQELVFSALTFEDIVVGGAFIAACWRQSSSAIRPDDQSRPEVFDTYYLRTDR